MREIISGEVLTELDLALDEFLKRETEIQNACLSQGASPDDLDRMFNNHFIEFTTSIFGPRWMKQLQEYGRKRP